MNEYQDCKFFGYRTCKHRDDEIMIKATQMFLEYHGGDVPIIASPIVEEINSICSTCDMFTPR